MKLLILAQGAIEDIAPEKEPEKVDEIAKLFDPEIMSKLMVVGPFFLIGLILIIGVTGFLHRLFRTRLNKPQTLWVVRLFRYVTLFLLTVFCLNQFNIEVGALLGAAGVLGLAVGFAAQTSLSNVIAGLFLRGEKPFGIGDAISVGGHTGLVDTIDMFSVTLRTFDNKSVRIPNETLVKTDVTNITRHPIRRCELTVGVDYSCDIERILAVLQDVAKDNYHALDEPEPFIMFKGFGDSSLDFMIGVWSTQEDYITTLNSLAADIQRKFQKEGIPIPYPHVHVVGQHDQENS
ncbi:MAG: mechanosensitive ion channel family protein [Verrucomicrobiota bacterium JB023]|nr:mechanosensitive ion channel family protein [Verrucomicrobiota bacterium JB023]